MGIARWLRRIFAEWFGPDESAPETALAAANSQVQATRAAAAHSIAAARRAEALLAEALEGGSASDEALRYLIASVEEQRRLAEEHIAEYHHQQIAFVEALREVAESAELERLNQERDRLLGLRNRALAEAEASHERLDEARGEAARLGVLEALESGRSIPGAEAPVDDDPRERARLVLAQARPLDI